MIERFQKLRYQMLASTWLSYAGFYFTRRAFSAVKRPLRDHLQVDDLQISYVWTTYLIAYMVGQFVAAALGKRMTSRSVLLGGMAVSIACNLAIAGLIGAGPSAYPWLIAVMAVHGVAQATGWPHNVGLIAQWTQRSERGRIMAFWSTCYQIGSGIAKAFAGWVYGLEGLAAAFVASSAVLALVWVLFFFWGHESPESKGLVRPDENVGHTEAARQRRPVVEPADAVVIRTIVAMGLIYFAFKFVRYALDSWTTLLIEEHFHLSTEHANYLATAFDFAGFIGVVLSGMWSDKIGSRTAVIFAMTVGLFLSSTLMWSIGLGSVAAFTILLAAIGFMALGPDALLSGAGAMDIGGARRAAMAAGVINGLGSIGPIVQEPMIGFFLKTSGDQAVFALLIVVTGLAVIGTGLLWRTAKKLGLPI